MASNTTLYVGAAEVDITPEPGMRMGGDACRPRYIEEILDPLHARAVIFTNTPDDVSQCACLLSLDLCMAGDDAADAIRDMIADRFGLRKEAVMFHIQQNHSAPSLGTHLMLRSDNAHITDEVRFPCEGDPAYYEAVVPKLLEVTAAALDRIEPVSMACGGMPDNRVARNRRYVMRDGWVRTQPGDLANVLHVEGPIDPEVGVACFRNEAGETIAALLHHTAHPLTRFHDPVVTASWPGAWARHMRPLLGEGCVIAPVNGCCGNVNSSNNMAPGLGPTPKPDDDQLARWLTESAEKVLADLQWSDDAPVAFRSREQDIPYGDIRAMLGDDSIAHARELLEREPDPRWTDDTHTRLDPEWTFAVASLDMLRRLPGNAYPYEVQAFRVGDLGLVALTGEPWAEGQLRLKMESPAARTFVAHMSNGWVGYLPTRAAHAAKNLNYRTPEGAPVRRGANLFLLAPDALDIAVDTARELLDDMFQAEG